MFFGPKGGRVERRDSEPRERLRLELAASTTPKWKNLVIFAVIVDYFMISSAIYGFCGLFSGYRHAPKMYIEFIV